MVPFLVALLCLGAALIPAGAGAATGSISGTISDASSHAAVAGVEVCAYAYSGEPWRFCDATDSGGEYTIGSLASGDYRVEFRAVSAGYVPQYYNDKLRFAEADKVTVEGSAIVGIDAAIVIGGTITGTVTEADGGEPFAGITVCAVTYSQPRYGGGCTVSDSSGGYVLRGLSADQYVVEFWPSESTDLLLQYYNHKLYQALADPVTVALGENVTGIDGSIEHGAKVEGTVRAAGGAPVAEANVCAWETGIRGGGGCADTAPDGTYLIDGLLPLTHKVEFSAPGMALQFWDHKSGWNEADDLHLVPEGTASGIDADLVPPADGVLSPAVIPPPAVTPPLVNSPRRHCRKGFRKKRVGAKVRCVRKKARHRRRHRPHHR
jgi:hypothetical protein